MLLIAQPNYLRRFPGKVILLRLLFLLTKGRQEPPCQHRGKNRPFHRRRMMRGFPSGRKPQQPHSQPVTASPRPPRATNPAENRNQPARSMNPKTHPMFDTPPKIALWATVIVLLAGCARLNSTSTETLPLYLEEMTPPCVPTESEPDPCPLDLPAPIAESNSQRPASLLMREVPSFTERLLWDSYYDGPRSVHIVVRGTVKTNTTRCDIYKDKS